MQKNIQKSLIDLVAAFRWTAHLDMHEGVANHFSLCEPGKQDTFYVQQAGIHFSRVQVKDFIKVTPENVEEIKKQPGKVDPTAINIHGEIHKQVKDANCILHVHSKYANVLSCLKNPYLPPIHQNTMRFYNRVAHFPFGGMGFEEEAQKMAQALQGKRFLLLQNHGILVVAPTVAQAFDEIYHFEKACEVYIMSLQTGMELNPVSHEIAEKTALEWENYPIDSASLHLEEIKKILDKTQPDYRFIE